MHKLAPIMVFYLGFAVCPLNAMNWEGHDDWMVDLPAAIVLQSATPTTPLPKRTPPACRSDTPPNPYEQIPLATHICPVVSPAIGHEGSGAKP